MCKSVTDNMELEQISRCTETHNIKSNTKELMKTLTNNVYGNPYVFLKEAISNSSDAIEKWELVKGKFNLNNNNNNQNYIQYIEDEPFIKIIPDSSSKTLTIVDNGIGMTKDDLINNIGVIASSGTKKFSAENNVKSMIGQFGIGFYSLFMVSNKVKIITTSFEENELRTHSWESTNFEDYQISKLLIGFNRSATMIILDIKNDFTDVLNSNLLTELIQKHTFYVKYPISIMFEPQENSKIKEPSFVTVNCKGVPVWRRKKSEIEDKDYKEFYKESIIENIRDKVDKNPLNYVHKKFHMKNGEIQIYFIFYIPSRAPYDLGEDSESGNKMKLYSKGILIDDKNTDYFPNWMNFCLGIIEINGLQLNINRQSHIDSLLVNEVKSTITIEFINLMIDLKENHYNHFHTLNNEFGECIKTGIVEELSNRTKESEEKFGIMHAKNMFKLLLFKTSKNRQVCFDDYVRDMKEDQIGIYYVAGGTEKVLANSPFIERIVIKKDDSQEIKDKKKDYEILFFTNNFDEHIKNYLVAYKKNENEIIVGIEDQKDEESLKLYDDINFDDLNTKRFIDTSRGDDLLIKFDKTNDIPEKELKKLIKILKIIYSKEKIHLHDIKSTDKFDSIPGIVVSQVNISAQFENYLNNQNISKRADQYNNVLKRKNLLISPANDTIKYLYDQLVIKKVRETDKDIVKFCKDMHSSAMLMGGYQITDFVTYAKNNFDYACASIMKKT